MDLWPQASSAEDQQLARTILTTHVVHRGFQGGALIGSLVGAARVGLRSRSAAKAKAKATLPTPALNAATSASSSPSTAGASALRAYSTTAPTPIPASASATVSSAFATRSPRAALVLRSAGTGALVGIGFGAVATFGRMWGREEIEWKDRSWRLLQSEGQVSVDRWSVVGAAAGVGAAVGAVGAKAAVRDWRLALGVVGCGSLLGVAGSMGSRMATGTFN